ncbi:CPBP family intramembrane glutamic endopeptidase [Saccharothrix coeruleofusca]|uniref:CPBP family intramembrane glutamic endopeptidase n=1 Tax=Saccharothrix coeruleofusca TaxID=33919 RepID=UPI001E652990|nr:CPBP family intramembrane glutamic endopeptidase [Saccharothrix coeruleofusca]
MLNKTGKSGVAVLVAGVAVFAGSVTLLVLTGNTAVRYSADHGDTVPVWTRWAPALAGIMAIRLVPARPPVALLASRGTRVEAEVLLAAALVFAVALRLTGGGEPAHVLLKLLLLLVVPLVLFRVRRGSSAIALGDRPRVAPVVPVAVWLLLSCAGPFALRPSDYADTVDTVTLIATVVVVFLVNSLLEEVFYRRWSQTRWEAVLGRWPAIVLVSLLWAGWHAAIQGVGDLPVDLASAFANQGAQGLFLGYLWSRYRLMWPLLVVHGAVNALPMFL